MIHYSKLRLKVLQGINEGAVVSFSSEILKIGSCPECDIILSGFSTSEPRIEISYIDHCLSIKVLNKPINLDGEYVSPSDEKMPLKLYQLISFDTCCLTVGEQGKEWPSCEDNKNYIEPIISNKIIRLPSIFSLNSNSKKNTLLFSVFVFTFIGFLYSANAKIPKNNNLLNGNSNSDVINNYSFKSMNQDNITDHRTVEKLAYGLLQTYGVNRIELSFRGNGILIAEGYVGDSIKWEKAKTSMLEDIKEINEVDTLGIETFTQRAMMLNEMLMNKDLKKNLQVSIDKSDGLIVVSGELTHKSVLDWNKIKNQFVSSYKDTPKLKSRITDLEKKIKLLIQSVNVGKTNYFTSKVGKKYMVGSELGKGFRVLEIDVEKIVLSYKGDRIPIYYSHELNKISSLKN